MTAPASAPSNPAPPGGPPPLQASDLSGWQPLARFLTLVDELAPLLPPGSREDHGLRTFDRRAYFSLFLLGLFNPVIQSLRGLCSATRLAKVQAAIGRESPVGLSRFSEAQAVFSPDLLQPVLAELLRNSAASVKGQASVFPGGKLSADAVRIVDSTLWKVLPRMKWAHWRTQHNDQNAVRLHIKLRLIDLQAAGADVTEGRVCERASWLAHAREGEFYIGDRYYGGDYGVLEELEKKGCGFLVRLRHTAVMEILETREADAEALAQGAQYDVNARLGHHKVPAKGPWRVVHFQKPGMEEPVTLVVSSECDDLSTLEVMELYRQRWQVEMFFRWLKCLVPCRHWFAESPEGVRLQIYLCLIQALLLAEMTGRRPTLRMMELLRWHQLGIASDAELIAGLARLAKEQTAAQARQAAKKAAAAKQK